MPEPMMHTSAFAFFESLGASGATATFIHNERVASSKAFMTILLTLPSSSRRALPAMFDEQLQRRADGARQDVRARHLAEVEAPDGGLVRCRDGDEHEAHRIA